MLVTFVGMIQCVMCNFVSGIDKTKSNFLMQTMAHQVEYGSASEASELSEVEDDASPAHSGEGPSESSEWSSFISGPPPSSELDDDASSSPFVFCQCEDEDTLLECSACGSFFELDTHCPWC
jgi:hypothetical protein